MQVSHQDDHITHAVIGNQDSVEMGVSDDAALMHILSSTLYTYPKLAVVREIICNGWDAHIAAGKTDTPLDITITGDQITVRDHGFGIAHKDIGPIYGVYGNSTKRDDSKSTGGFGLGSKAPFAYTDNFEVVSHHVGTKTVYRVSKSSLEKGGKPSINTIVQLPTQETGIAVSFGMKPEDRPEFLSLIKEVLRLGEIKAKINGEEFTEVLPLEASPTGYLFTSYWGSCFSDINLRYGNVVYPIPRREEYAKEYDTVLHSLEHLWNSTAIIFLAPPDSISIAPSREAVILTDGTVATIKGLLSSFKQESVEKAQETLNQLISEKLNEKVKGQSLPTLIQWLKEGMLLPPNFIGGKEGFNVWAYRYKEAYLDCKRSSRHTSCEVQERAIIQHLLKNPLINRKFLQEVRKKHHILSNWRTRKEASHSVMKHLQYPLIKMLSDPELAGVKTLVRVKPYTCDYLAKDFQKIYKEHESIYPLLHHKIVITQNRTTAKAYLEECPDKITRLFLLVGSNKASLDLVARLKQKLVHYRKPYEEYLPEKEVKVRTAIADGSAPAKKAKKKIGYLPLTASCDQSGKFLLSHARTNFQEDQLITDPVAWVTLLTGDRAYRITGLSLEASQIVNQMWGDKVAVVTSIQADKLTKQGVPTLTTFLETHVDKQLASLPEFKRYLAFGIHMSSRYNSAYSMLKAACFHPEFMASQGLRFGISKDTAVLIKLADAMGWHKLPECESMLWKIKQHPQVNEVLDKVSNSPWRKFIDMEKLSTALQMHEPNSADCKVPYEILSNLLKGK